MKVLLYAVFKDRWGDKPLMQVRHHEDSELENEPVPSKLNSTVGDSMNGASANDFQLSRQDPQPVNPSGATDS